MEKAKYNATFTLNQLAFLPKQLNWYKEQAIDDISPRLNQ